MITMNEMLATIHIQPDMYDLEHGREYRIGKEYNVSGVKTASLASCSSDDDVVKRLLSTHRRLSNF